MKQTTLLLFVMLLCTHVFGQKKKGKEDATTLKIDSLTLVNTQLTVQLDSASKQFNKQTLQLDTVTRHLKAHELMYTAIKDKVIKHDFDPARAGELIDSLRTSRDQTLAGLTSQSQVLTDSLVVLKDENAKLKTSVATWEARAGSNEEVVRDLEQLKGLLDQKIITQTEFDTRKTKLMAKWK